MYKVQSTSIISDDDMKTNNLYEFQVGYDYQSDYREIHDMSEYWSKKYPSKQFEGFDQWRLLLSREEELSHCKSLIEKALQEKRRIHISNITCREVAEYISEHYHERAYFTDYPRKCIVPKDACITVSVAIASLCYSEKEKNKNPYEIVSPYTPIRSSSDQKYLTTMIRTGVISQVDTGESDNSCIKKLLKEEVLSPFLIGQILYYQAEKNTMTTEKIETVQIDTD